MANITLHNIAEIDSGGQVLCRVPFALRSRLNPGAQLNALQTAGCELRFNLEEDPVTLTLQMIDRPALAEIYYGPFLHAWHVIQLEPTTIEITAPENLENLLTAASAGGAGFDPRLVRVVLPWRPAVRLLALEGQVSPAREEQTPNQTMLIYGSSITQGNHSTAPSATYAMRLAHRLKVDLINLGFGSGALLEPEMAEYIAGRGDWDFAVLELGINMFPDFDEVVFAKRVDHFLEIIAKEHADKWIFVLDMLPFFGDLEPANPKADAFRSIVRTAVKSRNLPKMLHIDGRAIIPDPSELSADLLHPTSAGMDTIARHLEGVITEYMGTHSTS